MMMMTMMMMWNVKYPYIAITTRNFLQKKKNDQEYLSLARFIRPYHPLPPPCLPDYILSLHNFGGKGVTAAPDDIGSFRHLQPLPTEKSIIWLYLQWHGWEIIIIIIIMTNHIKARISKMQQNSRCRLCGDRDEMINHIIIECSKLAQKEYKTKHEWVGKMILWELCKKLKFDHTNKWYMHNPDSVIKNKTHKLLCDFDIQTDPLIFARQSDLIIINKKERKLAKL